MPPCIAGHRAVRAMFIQHLSSFVGQELPLEETSRGLLFEEFEVGRRAISPARTITESDIVQFAGLTGDYNR